MGVEEQQHRAARQTGCNSDRLLQSLHLFCALAPHNGMLHSACRDRLEVHGPCPSIKATGRVRRTRVAHDLTVCAALREYSCELLLCNATGNEIGINEVRMVVVRR